MDHTDVKIALITGTSSGFGLLCSLALAKSGCHVIATMRDLTKKSRLDQAVREAGLGARVEYVRLDVTDEERIVEVVEDLIDRFGHIDVLINNAGFATGGYVEDVPMDEWRRQLDTNLFGTIALTKSVLPHMRSRRSGSIVNISSISGRVAFPGLGPYSTSKFALEGFTESLRLEMLPYGVKVLLIEPGSYKTEIWNKGMDQFEGAAESHYRHETAVMLRGVRHIAETARNPIEVVRLIARVLSMGRPRLRYPIGPGVRRLILLKSVLPWVWIEHTIMKRFVVRE